MNWSKFPKPRLWTHVLFISIGAIEFDIVLITIKWYYYTYLWWNLIRWGMMIDCWRRICKTLWSQTFTSIMMACTLWSSSIEVYIVILLVSCVYYDVIEMSWLCQDVRLCLRWYDIMLVMNCLCELLWHDDYNVLITHTMILLKGISHEVIYDLMI